MTSMRQECPLCKSPLLKFLYNVDKDFVINCSSRVCLYGVLHAKIYKADSNPVVGPQIATPQPEGGCTERQFFDFLDGINDVEINQDGSVPNADNTHTEPGGQVERPKPPYDQEREPNADLTKSFISLDGLQELAMRCPTKDDDMINQWVQELMETPKESSPQPPTEIPPEVHRLPKRTAAKRVPVLPVVRKREPITKSKTATKAPKMTKTARASRAMLQKSQALSSFLKSNVGVPSPVSSDYSPSDASSESGIQSDASDLSSASLTPIQRLLHIEEAKKRSWGATGMPGFQPSATQIRRKP